MRKSKWPLRDRSLYNYGEMGSNPWRLNKRRGKKRGCKAGKQRQPKKINIKNLVN